MDDLIYIHKYDIGSHSFCRNQIDGRSSRRSNVTAGRGFGRFGSKHTRFYLASKRHCVRIGRSGVAALTFLVRSKGDPVYALRAGCKLRRESVGICARKSRSKVVS
jgi:hypothetical protein